jgi:hypothetical protein
MTALPGSLEYSCLGIQKYEKIEKVTGSPNEQNMLGDKKRGAIGLF